MNPTHRLGERDLTRGRAKQKLLYRQLADVLRERIENGRLKPGSMLPSMDDLARKYSIHKATVRRAIAQLTLSGHLRSVPSRGTFVLDDSARQQKSSRVPAIGWVISVSDNGRTGRYHTEIMDAVQTALQEINGHLVIISAVGQSASAISRIIGEAQLNGIVLIGGFPHETIRHLAGTGMPAVLIDDTCRGAALDSILIDNRSGGYEAARHLISLGHRRLAFVTGIPGLKITEDRLAGAWEAVDEAGISRDRVQVIPGDFSPRSGRLAATRIIAANPQPTGAFFFNDEMASAALQTFYEHSDLRIPEDLSIVGFDDTTWASLTPPPLTTIHVEKELIGREAVLRLRRKMTEADYVPTTSITPTRLVVRKSTASPTQRGAK